MFQTKYDQNQAKKLLPTLENVQTQQVPYTKDPSILLQSAARYENNNSQSQLLGNSRESMSNGVVNGHVAHSFNSGKGKHRQLSVVRLV